MIAGLTGTKLGRWIYDAIKKHHGDYHGDYIGEYQEDGYTCLDGEFDLEKIAEEVINRMSKELAVGYKQPLTTET
jgi:hypothetical protein